MSKLTVVSYSFIALALSALVCGQSTVPNSAAVPAVGSIQQVGIMCSLDGKTGLPKQITTRAQAAAVQWLTGPSQFHVRNEATNVTSTFTGRVAERGQTPSGAVSRRGLRCAFVEPHTTVAGDKIRAHVGPLRLPGTAHAPGTKSSSSCRYSRRAWMSLPPASADSSAWRDVRPTKPFHMVTRAWPTILSLRAAAGQRV